METIFNFYIIIFKVMEDCSIEVTTITVNEINTEPPAAKECQKLSNDTESDDCTILEEEEVQSNNLIFSFAAGSIVVLGLLIVGFAGFRLYKAKFSRRRNFNYTLSEDNGNIVGDENRVTC